MKPGQTLSHYRLVEQVGEGGMGEVWKAIDTRLDRTVAIKTLPQHLSEAPERRQRFEREARTIARLSHPHICTLFDIGRENDADFLVMEYIDGEVLADRLRQGPLPIDQVLRCGNEIAQAMHEAHRAGIVHRDLKPGNVMLTRRGVKLLDFGLAKLTPAHSADLSADVPTTAAMMSPLTSDGLVLGTVPYMAPEQLEGREADARTDIFAFGGILYEMATGRRAFTAASQAGLISAIMTADPPSVLELQPGAPPFLDHLITRCLAKDPDARWQSASDLAGQLEWIAGKAASARAPKEQPVPSKAGRRIAYFRSADGASIAGARGGEGPPLVIVPTMVDTIATGWAMYAAAFPDHEVITFDRRGTGLSERGTDPGDPEAYLQDAQVVLDGFDLGEFDLLGALLGTVEAASLASRNAERVRRLVLRSPVIGLADWAAIPAVRAALAALDQDWEFFTEAFSQLVVGWGSPKGRVLAGRYRDITSREELRSLLGAYTKLDLKPAYVAIRAPTLVEHHPAYFFPDTYSRSIASMIAGCRMAIYSGPESEFMTDLSIARAFLKEVREAS